MSARRAPRHLHPFAWWLWAGGLAAAAMRTTNLVLLALVLAVVAFVVGSRRTAAPWSRSFATFLRLGALVIVIRVVVQALVGVPVGDTVLFRLPEVALPAALAGVRLGGEVTLEAVLQSIAEGGRLAVLLACFGAVNSLTSPYRVLRALPAVLYEAGVAVSMGVAFTPEAVASVARLREARALRGRSERGIGALRGVAVPVLEGALDRSVALAASMDARGYGRRGAQPASARRLSTLALLGGLLGATVGTYGVLDASAPRALALPALSVGVALLALVLARRGTGSGRTRYRPDRWGGAEWLVTLSGAVALAAVGAADRLDPSALNPAFVPLRWPVVPAVAVAGVLAGALPAWCAPVAPGIAAPGTDGDLDLGDLDPGDRLGRDPARPADRSARGAADHLPGAPSSPPSTPLAGPQPTSTPAVDPAIGATR